MKKLRKILLFLLWLIPWSVGSLLFLIPMKDGWIKAEMISVVSGFISVMAFLFISYARTRAQMELEKKNFRKDKYK